MLSVFNELRDFSFASILLRVLLTVISAGIIGYERGRGGRAAGLRTHILVALGACLVMSVDQYLVTVINSNADPARLGAQVINGIGFLGAGTILATGKRVTGLTTAAGLWTMACVGLAYGCGYFEGGIVATITVLVVVTVFREVEGHTGAQVSVELLVEIEKPKYIPCLLEIIKEKKIRINNISITEAPFAASKGHLEVVLSLSVAKNYNMSELLDQIVQKMPVVRFQEL